MDIDIDVPSEFYGDWKEKLDKKDGARARGGEWKANSDAVSSKGTEPGVIVNPEQQKQTEATARENHSKEPTRKSLEDHNTTNVEPTEHMEVEPEKSKSSEVNPLTETPAGPIIRKPTLKDYKLPETDEEMETLIKSMEAGGAMRIKAETNIKSRRAAFNKAIREYEKEMRLCQCNKEYARRGH